MSKQTISITLEVTDPRFLDDYIVTYAQKVMENIRLEINAKTHLLYDSKGISIKFVKASIDPDATTALNYDQNGVKVFFWREPWFLDIIIATLVEAEFEVELDREHSYDYQSRGRIAGLTIRRRFGGQT